MNVMWKRQMLWNSKKGAFDWWGRIKVLWSERTGDACYTGQRKKTVRGETMWKMGVQESMANSRRKKVHCGRNTGIWSGGCQTIMHQNFLKSLFKYTVLGRKSNKKRAYMYTYSWFTLPYSRNEHNIVKQLYSNKNFLIIFNWGKFSL